MVHQPSRTVDSMSRLGFVGLLPDENRFSWPFLAYDYIERQDSEALCNRIRAISEASGTDLDPFKPLIDKVLSSTPLNEALLQPDEGPESVWKWDTYF